MMSSNVNRLKIIAAGLGDLCRDVVFVGGSVAELYADDPAATDIRPNNGCGLCDRAGNLRQFAGI